MPVDCHPDICVPYKVMDAKRKRRGTAKRSKWELLQICAMPDMKAEIVAEAAARQLSASRYLIDLHQRRDDARRAASFEKMANQLRVMVVELLGIVKDLKRDLDRKDEESRETSLVRTDPELLNRFGAIATPKIEKMLGRPSAREFAGLMEDPEVASEFRAIVTESMGEARQQLDEKRRA